MRQREPIEVTGKNVWRNAVLIFGLFLVAMALWPAPSAAGGGAARPHGCTSSAVCADAGTYAFEFVGGAVPQKLSYRSDSTSHPWFAAGAAGTYVVQAKFAGILPNSGYQHLGGTYTAYNLGGWGIYLLPTTADAVFVNCPANAPCTTALESGPLLADVWYTFCVHKSAGNIYQFRINNTDAGVSTIDTTSEHIQQFALGYQPSFPSGSPMVGKVRNVAFFEGVEFSNASCAAFADGTANIASYARDAGMVFGWSLNSTGDDMSGNGRLINVVNDVKFVRP